MPSASVAIESVEVESIESEDLREFLDYILFTRAMYREPSGARFKGIRKICRQIDSYYDDLRKYGVNSIGDLRQMLAFGVSVGDCLPEQIGLLDEDKEVLLEWYRGGRNSIASTAAGPAEEDSSEEEDEVSEEEEQMTREASTDQIPPVRLLEKLSADPIESEVLDVLWEMVETVVTNGPLVEVVLVRTPFMGDYLEAWYVWDKETNELSDCDDGTIMGKMVTDDDGEWVPVDLTGERLDVEEEFGDLDWFASSSEEEESHSCDRCHHPEHVIISRGFGWEDYLSHPLADGEELICQSCAVAGNLNPSENYYCVDCGYSEALCKQFHGEQLGQFYLEGQTRPEYQDENTRCQGCRARVERYEREDREEQVAVTRAERLADDSHDRVNRVLFPENDEEEVLSGDIDEWGETYVGELELAEENEDNDEEVALRVKNTVQEMGEVLFDIMGDISEGTYLKLMDGLQSITNEMNH